VDHGQAVSANNPDAGVPGAADAGVPGAVDAGVPGAADAGVAGAVDAGVAGAVDAGVAGAAGVGVEGAGDAGVAGAEDAGVTGAVDACVVGVDFGTLSGRAVVVRVRDGAELGTAVYEYPHGVMDATLAATGEPLPPDWALQDPEDYCDVLRHAVPAAVASAGIDPARVVGIATDFTACTVLPVLADGTPLCQVPALAGRPHAYPKLWKHHAAQPQADRINALAHERHEPWIGRYGGKISSEWEFAKGLQLLEEDPFTYQQADRWIEAADWIIWQLTGAETRNACTAGYKGIRQDGRYPSREFLGRLHPGFARFAADKLEHPVLPLGARAGSLTPRAAAWTGLPEGIAVAVGNVDAHVTAPAAAAIAPGQMVAIMGTSTCHVMNGARLAEVPGMCGVVDGGIVAGMWGYEAGQSGVGDIFAWFTDHAVPAEYREEAERRGVGLYDLLSAEAAKQSAGAHGLIALDWLSGNRSVLVDHHLSGVIVGLTLATRAPDIYRALVESTAFGTRVIIDTFTASGIPVTELVVAGGLVKDDFVLQVYADVTRRPLSVIASEQGPALGSAIHAAVAAGCYPDVPAAAEAMGGKHRAVYLPDPASADVYDRLYAEYLLLHDYFGRGGNEVMHRLRAIRDRLVATAPASTPPAGPDTSPASLAAAEQDGGLS
jgi:L-ribulokinase